MALLTAATSGARRDSIEAPDTLDGSPAKLVGRRDGAEVDGARRAGPGCLLAVRAPARRIVAADALEGLAAVRAARLFCAAPVERVCRGEGVTPAAAAEQRAEGKWRTLPDRTTAFESPPRRSLGEDSTKWRDAHGPRCLRTP